MDTNDTNTRGDDNAQNQTPGTTVVARSGVGDVVRRIHYHYNDAMQNLG